MKNFHRQIFHHAGFTVIEMLVTVALIGILAGVATPSFLSMMDNMALKKSQDTVLVALKKAKRIARSQGTIVVVTISNTPANININPSNAAPKNHTLSENISFENDTVITFSSVGTVTPPAGEAMFRIKTKSSATNNARYVDITASGQIIVRRMGFAPS